MDQGGEGRAPKASCAPSAVLPHEPIAKVFTNCMDENKDKLVAKMLEKPSA